MAKEKDFTNKYQTRSDVEKWLKSDKNFMNSHSAAEFDAYVEGALWMINEKQVYIDWLKDRIKNNRNKIIGLEQELAPFKELYENFDFVEKRSKKSKKKMPEINDYEDDEEDLMRFQEDYDDSFIDDNNDMF